MWEKIKGAFKHSVTILWARILSVLGALLVVLPPILQDPSFNSAVQSLLRPEHIPYFIIAIGILTEIARQRTAGKS